MDKLEKILKNEPKFRLGQIKKALFFDLIENWDETSVLPKDLREKLNKEFNLAIDAKVSDLGEEVIKALITLKDGLKIETVLMKHGDPLRSEASGRNTVCVSSQVGCPLGCAFCATGKLGFKRNLTDWEIIQQVLFFARLLKKTKEKITNIVFMGMGEPFLNYDNVLQAIKTLNDKEGFNLGGRHFSISTAGIIEGIERLADEKIQITLAISLHAPNDKLRSELMPINKKYSIEKILKAVDDYIKKTRSRVMFEYIMIKGVNDSDKCAQELAKILKGRLAFANLISYNPTGIFDASPGVRIKKFREILEKNGINVTQRYKFGGKIKGACGQLAGK